MEDINKEGQSSDVYACFDNDSEVDDDKKNNGYAIDYDDDGDDVDDDGD